MTTTSGSTVNEMWKRAAVIQNAWEDIAGVEISLAAARRMGESHWTVGMVGQMTRWARHAVEQQTGTYQAALTQADPRASEFVHVVAEMETAIRLLIAQSLMTLTEAFGWVEALIGDPNHSVVWHADYLRPSNPGLRPVRVQAWALRIPPEVAPWAYAAGLTPAEARGQVAAGRLDVPTLRALATLRGFRVPQA